MTRTVGTTANARATRDDVDAHAAAAAATARAGSLLAGARTPEELETLFEDTLMLRDQAALAALFADGAVLLAGDGPPARGADEIARLALATWDDDRAYVADPLRVVQARDIALIVAEQGISVARRGSDGAWRYAISLQSLDDAIMKEGPVQ